MSLIFSRTWAVLVTGFLSTGCAATAAALGVVGFSSFGRCSVNRRPSRRTSLYPGFCWDPVLQLLFLLVAFAAALAGFDFFLRFPTGDEASFLGGLFLFLSDLLFDLVDLVFFLFFFEIFVV
ncbi:MAG: hypothetical protein DMG78_30955, partial [Acidobacteria bacterium]